MSSSVSPPNFPMHPGYESGLYYPPPFFGSAGGNTMTVGVIFYTYFYISRSMNCTGIAINVITNSPLSLIRLGIYNIINGNPVNLIIDAGQISTATRGAKTATLNILLSPGWYAIAVAGNSAAVALTFNGTDAVSGFMIGQANLTQNTAPGKRATFAFGPFPAIAPLTSAIAVATPVTWLRAA